MDLSCAYAAQYEAQLAKKSDATIYTIGYNTGTDVNDVLCEHLQRLGLCLTAGSEEIDKIFGQIGQSIEEQLTSAVSDPMGSYFVDLVYDGAVPVPATSSALTNGDYHITGNKSTVSFDKGTETFSWSPDLSEGKAQTLTYKIRLDVEQSAFSMESAYEANGKTTFEYKIGENGEKKTIEFNVPTVNGVYGTVKKVGVLVDENGNYLNEDGEIVTDPTQAEVLVQAEDVRNTAKDSTHFLPDAKGIEVTAPDVQNDEYALFGPDTQTVDLSYSANNKETYNKVVYFGYYAKGGYITIAKRAYDNKGDLGAVAGARFGVYTSEADAKAGEDEVMVITSDDFGNYKSEKLAAGTYYVKEIAAPSGYLISDEIYTVTVENGKETALNGGDNVINIATTQVTVSKSWDDDNNRFSTRPTSSLTVDLYRSLQAARGRRSRPSPSPLKTAGPRLLSICPRPMRRAMSTPIS